MTRRFIVGFAVVAGIIVVGCARDDMWYQKKVENYETSDFFEDGVATRLPVENTVIRGSIKDDSLLYDGMENGATAVRFPFAVTKESLERGQDRYGHFCAPCHGQTGDGFGMIVQRGFKQPLPFTDPSLMAASPGYFFRVLSVGYSAANDGKKMSGLNTSEGKTDYVHPVLLKKMGAEDVWATIAYIRALQRSQATPASTLTPDEMEEVTNPKKHEEAAGGGH
jgi:hypothetical protein